MLRLWDLPTTEEGAIEFFQEKNFRKNFENVWVDNRELPKIVCSTQVWFWPIDRHFVAQRMRNRNRLNIV